MKRATWPQIGVLLLLGAIATFATWDYVEVVRLDRELQRIRRRGEPAALDDVRAVSREQESAASRFYRAAAALVTDPVDGRFTNRTLFTSQLHAAHRSNSWPDELIAEMRRQVSANGDALEYLDRAAALEFTGFPETSAYWTREMEMFELLRITGLRTTLLAIEGRAAAAASLHSGLKILHAQGFWGDGSIQRSRSLGLGMLMPAMEMVLTRTRPPDENLAVIADDLAAMDIDDLMRHDLLWWRASSQIDLNSPYWFRRRTDVGAFKFGESLTTAFQTPIRRPFLLHRMNRILRDYRRAIDVQAAKSWPGKLDAMKALDGQLVDGVLSRAEGVVGELARIRSSRTVVAIERYRRTGATAAVDWRALAPFQTPLIDPYSGQPLRIVSDHLGYVAYSIGRDRRDDGGDPAHDIGLHISTNPQSPIPNP